MNLYRLAKAGEFVKIGVQAEMMHYVDCNQHIFQQEIKRHGKVVNGEYEITLVGDMMKVQEIMLYNKNEELAFIGTREEVVKFFNKPKETVLKRIITELSHQKTKGTTPKLYGYTIAIYEGDITDKGE